MAEVIVSVATASSIAGLVSLTIQLIEISRRYISSYKTRPRSIEAIHRELEALKQVFTELRNISDNPRYRPYLGSLSSSKVDGCYHELEGIHSRLKRQEQGSRLSKKFNALIWPFNESECGRLVKRLHFYQGSFHTAISADSFKINVEVLNRIEKQVKEEHLREFSPAKFWTNQSEAWKKHEPGTGTWFLESDQYNDWLRDSGGSLCIYGLPGTGKTVLCSTVVRDIDIRRDEHQALVYFYYDFRDRDKQTTAHCLRSLIVQLISLLGSVPEECQRLFPSDISEKGIDLEEQGLFTALYTLCKHFLRTYIVIDALDESSETVQIVDKLLQIAALDECDISWLVTCRREKKTEVLMEVPLLCTVTLKGPAVNHDIEIYVRKCVSNGLTMLPAWMKRKVETALLEKAGGMFRWIDCQLESLKDCLTASDVELVLQSLPPSLDETYQRILLQIPRLQWQKALTALEFLAFAKFPLMVEEISDAVVVVPGSKRFDPEDRLFFDVIKLFPSLVSQAAHSEITLAHASVKDYMTSSRIRQGPAAFFALSQETADLHIAEICLTQLLSLDEPAPWLTDTGFEAPSNCWSTSWEDQVVNRENLLYYSAHCWIGHCQMIRPEHPSMLRSLCLNLLRDGNKPVFINWYTIVENLLEYTDTKRVNIASIPSPLSFMSELGQKNMVLLLLHNGVDPNYGGGVDYLPLHVALSQGHTDIVMLLLSCGANANGTHKTGKKPVITAAARGDIPSMRMLIEAGADVNVRDSIAGSALQAAAARNTYPKALQWLLEAGADVNAQGGRYNTALQAVVAKASEFGAQLPLVPQMSRFRWNDERGIINAHFSDDTENSKTITHDMNENQEGEWSVRLLDNLRLLLSWDADVNLSGGTYGTALQAAAAFQNLEAIRLLLERGAKIDTICGRYGTALQAAAISGSTPILKLLLEAGADVNAGGGKYSAALQAAAARPKSEINIQILLDSGADINFRGGAHGSALHATIPKCSMENMKLLIDAGADVNAITGLHGTPLQAAAAYGSIEPLKILLAAGADPTTEAGQHGTPLRAAQHYNVSAEMVRLLQMNVVKWSRGALAPAGNDDRPASIPVPGRVLGNRNDTYSEYEAAHMDTDLASVISKSALQAEA